MVPSPLCPTSLVPLHSLPINSAIFAYFAASILSTQMLLQDQVLLQVIHLSISLGGLLLAMISMRVLHTPTLAVPLLAWCLYQVMMLLLR